MIGVVLSGALSDGAHGLLTIKRHGGLAIVQDTDEAQFPSMPLSAIEHVDVDHVTAAGAIGPLLGRLVREEIDRRTHAPAPSALRDPASGTSHALHQDRFTGPPTAFTCPDCDGALSRWRCHVGHAFSVDGLVSAQDRVLEEAIGTAVRALEERAVLARRLAVRARSAGQSAVAARFVDDAAELELKSNALRAVLADDATGGARRPESAARRPQRRRGRAHRRRARVAR